MDSLRRPVLLPAIALGLILGLELGVDLNARPTLKVVLDVLYGGVLVGFFGLLAIELGRFVRASTTRVSRRTSLRVWLGVRRVDVLIAVAIAILLPVSVRLAASLAMLRIGLSAVSTVIRTPRVSAFLARHRLSPSQTVALSFVAMIGVGTLFLLLPAATVDGQGASFTDAVFTVTSATTVTGLIVQDTGSYFSFFGQVVLIVIMQIGAIGIMVLAAAFAVLVGGRLVNSQQDSFEFAGMGSLLDVYSAEGLRKLVVAIAASTFIIEAITAALFYVMWLVGLLNLPVAFDSASGALWWSIFYAISAFCHAGFTLTSDSLSTWVGDPLVSNIFALVITISQLGFAVIADLWFSRSWRLLRTPTKLWSNLHVQSRVVIVMTLILNVVGALFFLYFEFDRALGDLSLPAKVNAAWFQSITLRSAGFNTVDFGAIAAPTLLLCLVWMFIGAAPGSVGGGVRTTTTAVVALAVRAMARGREDVEVFGRTVPKIIVYRSLTVFIVAGASCIVLLVALAATQEQPLGVLLFEGVSAFGTVGVSMGATAQLDATGKWIITLLMYIGRIGPLTMALAVSTPVGSRYRYPACEIAVG